MDSALSVLNMTFNNCIKRVASFEELVATPFAGGVNAICWERRLPGDFAEVAAKLGPGEAIRTLDEEPLQSLKLTADGLKAVHVMLEDLRLLQEHGKAPLLNCIGQYPRDEGAVVVATDVMSWHVDSAPVEADTWLCTYHGAPSEGLRNDEARRKVDIPEIRAALLKEYGGEDSDAFREWLTENCYDLHYAPLPGAKPYSFGIGNLWRIAIEHPGNSSELRALSSELPANGSGLTAHGSQLTASPPCIHRAPDTKPGDPARLLLIS